MKPEPLGEEGPDAAGWLAPYVMKCLEKARDRRFASCTELGERLADELDQRPREAARFDVLPRPARMPSRLHEAHEQSREQTGPGSEFTTVFLREPPGRRAPAWLYPSAVLLVVAGFTWLAWGRGSAGRMAIESGSETAVAAPSGLPPLAAVASGPVEPAERARLADRAVVEGEALLASAQGAPAAAAKFREALGLVPGHVAARAALDRLGTTWLARGDAARAEGRYADALAAYSEARALGAGGPDGAIDFERLVRAAEEDQAFVEACGQGRSGLEAYLAAAPDGRHAARARGLVERSRTRVYELEGGDRGLRAAVRLTQRSGAPALSLRVEHEHGFWPFASGCEGTLFVTARRLAFQSSDKPSDSFDLPIAQLVKLEHHAKDGPVLSVDSGKREYHLHVLFESADAAREKWGYKVQGSAPVYALLEQALEDFDRAVARHFARTWPAEACRASG